MYTSKTAWQWTFMMFFFEYAVSFFGLGSLLEALRTGNFNATYLISREGLQSIIFPIFPLFLVVEILFIAAIKRRDFSSLYRNYKIPFLNNVAGKVLMVFVSFNAFLFCSSLFSKFALFDVGYHWYSYVYAYVIWEFSHFVYHFTCHKVRILWCLHSPHHAPEHMNLSVIFTGFFLQGVYATIVRTSICTLLGLPLPLLFFVMVIDGCWGALIHIGEDMMPKGKLGPLYRFILTPSHHRVHHARNPQYIDKNYCNLLNVWDRAFGTYQEEIEGVKPKYGVARKINANSFFDTYFGEIYLLVKDVVKTRSFKDKLLTIVMPPGWKPSEPLAQVA